MLTTAALNDLLTVLPTPKLGHVSAKNRRVSVGDVRFIFLHMQIRCICRSLSTFFSTRPDVIRNAVFFDVMVCDRKWLGNTPGVANKHYLTVTEDHFQMAAGGVGQSEDENWGQTGD